MHLLLRLMGVSITSRNGKDFTDVLWNLARELRVVMHDGDVRDGEVYVHGWSFQRIISAVKRETLDTYELEFHGSITQVNRTCTDRFDKSRKDYFMYKDLTPMLKLVPSYFLEGTTRTCNYITICSLNRGTRA